MELTFADEKKYTKEEVGMILAVEMRQLDELMDVDNKLVVIYDNVSKWQARLDMFDV